MKNREKFKGSIKSPVKGPVKTYSGTVLTTEDEERKFRRQRGKEEKIQVRYTSEKSVPFGDYQVQGMSGLQYVVEFRSFRDPSNSCSCPDFAVNRLQTCKHVEAVLHFVQNTFEKDVGKNSSKIEIYLQRGEDPGVCISWPAISDSKMEKARQILDPYFSRSHKLIADPVEVLPLIENALKFAPADVQESVRISPQLQEWFQSEKHKRSHRLTQEQFLRDVKAGNHSMQMLNATLYPYQEEGMLHLAFKGRALLADEMGLGKTIQAIAACELLRRINVAKRVVVVTPASLKGEWEEQIGKFTGLSTLIVHGSRAERLKAYQKQAFFYLLNYEQVRSDFEDIQRILSPDIVVLDEAQRIKNWQTKTAWAVKQLKSPYAFVLTGTPLENRVDEIYSIMQMIDPHVLGPLYEFNKTYFQFNERNKPVGYKNLDQLHEKLQNVILRRLKSNVEEQLPERTVSTRFVEMHPEQTTRYEEYSMSVASLCNLMKRRPLTESETKKMHQALACMRMLADTPYILDEECRISPKLDELKEVLAELLESPANKIIIFSEWERMLLLVRECLRDELKVSFAWHTGTVQQQKRRDEIKRFKEDPNCRIFLSTDSGSVGLNLQVANVVINLDLPWNPAKLEQRIARAWRKHQTRAVQVINFVSENTIEHRMLNTLAQKQTLAQGVLDGMGDLSSMPMPSARQQILEQLDELFLDPVEETNAGKKDEGSSSLNDIKLDENTLQLLQRLAEAGIITIHQNEKDRLVASDSAKRERDENERRSKAAQPFFEEAHKKIRMAKLLVSGGFIQEARAPAENALEKGLKGFQILHNQIDPAGALLQQNVNLEVDEMPENEVIARLNLIEDYIKKYFSSTRRS